VQIKVDWELNAIEAEWITLKKLSGPVKILFITALEALIASSYPSSSYRLVAFDR